MADNHRYSLSRRKLLAGLGTVGLASAGAGLGTTAYFNDTESFEDNMLQAGELDLKVDWQHKYFGPEASAVYGSAGRPYVNAFPDDGGDGKRDDFETRGEISARLGDGATAAEAEAAYRAQFADVPNDIDSPIIDLHDVKPGDRGCLSLSLHLFDNPGYIWLGGELTGENENGQSEPEAEADGTANGAGELADSISARLWYDDDGNCEFDGTGVEGDADVMIVLDRSGSMASEANKFQNAKDGAKTLVDALGSAANVGLVSYATSATLDSGLTTDHASVKTAIDGLTASGTTNMGAAVDTAHAELVDNGTSTTQIMVFLTNGNPVDSPLDPVTQADEAKSDGIEVYTIAYGSDANASLLASMSSDPDSQYSYLAVDIASVEAVFALIGEIIAGETEIVAGTLREVLDTLADGVPLDGNRVDEGRQCFVNSTTQYIGLEWEVPAEVGNEIQTDSVSFDLELYAEQCRHNDGSNNPFNETSA